MVVDILTNINVSQEAVSKNFKIVLKEKKLWSGLNLHFMNYYAIRAIIDLEVALLVCHQQATSFFNQKCLINICLTVLTLNNLG